MFKNMNKESSIKYFLYATFILLCSYIIINLICYRSNNMELAKTVGHSIGATIWILILALILAAIVHFILGDGIWTVLGFYILIALFPRIITNVEDTKSSAIVGSILTIVFLYLIITFIFPMIFGPNIGFPYSMLGLGPFVTGLIVMILVDLISVSLS